MVAVYIDTETTGLSRSAGDELVEVALVDDDGAVLPSTLVNPGFHIPPDATEIHGITDDMAACAPDADTVRRWVTDLIAGNDVVIYNVAFDSRFLDLGAAASVSCCMIRYAEHHGDWSNWHESNKWQPLSVAAHAAGHVWTGDAHRALADAQACRTIWRWLPGAEAAAAAQREAEAAREEERWLTRVATRECEKLEACRLNLGPDRAAANQNGVEARRLARLRLARLRRAVHALAPAIKAVEPPLPPRTRIRQPDCLEKRQRPTVDRCGTPGVAAGFLDLALRPNR